MFPLVEVLRNDGYNILLLVCFYMIDWFVFNATFSSISVCCYKRCPQLFFYL